MCIVGLSWHDLYDKEIICRGRNARLNVRWYFWCQRLSTSIVFLDTVILSSIISDSLPCAKVGYSVFCWKKLALHQQYSRPTIWCKQWFYIVRTSAMPWYLVRKICKYIVKCEMICWCWCERLLFLIGKSCFKDNDKLYFVVV